MSIDRVTSHYKSEDKFPLILEAKSKIGRLTVVGAGPGDLDLITVKALKVLRVADIILYDALVNEELLSFANKSATCIFVGKRKGCYAYKQEEINDMILQYAKKGNHVVRLKGGDPFVFGRGAEEMDYVSKHGVITHTVPGITSCIAVPEQLGISLTKRGYSQSFWVITATTRYHELSKDVLQAAKSDATVVILMGIHKAKEIVGVFTKEGKANLAVTVIQNGTRSNERSIHTTIACLIQDLEKNSISSPAIIVIGKVAHEVSPNARQDPFWKSLSNYSVPKDFLEELQNSNSYEES